MTESAAIKVFNLADGELLPNPPSVKEAGDAQDSDPILGGRQPRDGDDSLERPRARPRRAGHHGTTRRLGLPRRQAPVTKGLWPGQLAVAAIRLFQEARLALPRRERARRIHHWSRWWRHRPHRILD